MAGLQLTPRPPCRLLRGGRWRKGGRVTCLRHVESNTGVGDCECVREKVLEGSDRQTDRQTHRLSVHYMMVIIDDNDDCKHALLAQYFSLYFPGI